MLIRVSIRPEEVLGVPPGAPLAELRAAYHDKALRHHPDQQGDAWAFRIVNEAFELLCRDRVSARLAEEENRAPAPTHAPAESGSHDPSHVPHHESAPHTPRDANVSVGIQDPVDNPAHLIDVELLLIRFAIDDPTEFLLTSPEQRNLSCSLSLNWPVRGDLERTLDPKDAAQVLKTLNKLVTQIVRETKPQGHVQQQSNSRYLGWLTYPTAQAANRAFRQFHQAVRNAGLGVTQRTRELIVDRPAE